jgi:TRAP-type mannitol/chloroaromatic compound transport system substrate-binding protein
MQSAFGSQLPHLGPSGVRFSKDIERMSGGRFEVKFFEPGALLPPLECFDAVSKGSVEACWTTPGYHTGKYPALAFFTTVPFGPGFGEFLAWKWYGGGNKLRDEIYAKHGLMAFDCFCIGPETSGWFRSEIKSVEEFKGLKMRFFGLGANVMQKLGVATQLLQAGEIFQALQLGTIDATEFSMPAMDLSLGFHQVAKFYYFPGWHQQSTFGDMIWNKAKWDSLSETQKFQVETACNAAVLNCFALSEYAQFGALQELQKKGVQFKTWDDKVMKAYEKAWDEVADEQAKKSPAFKEAYDSLQAFRKNYGVWRERGYLK